MFRVGDSIKLRENSPHYNEAPAALGIVSRVSGAAIYVRWANGGSEYCYNITDLEKIDPNKESIHKFYKALNLDDEDKLLVKAGIYNDDLKLTDEGKDIVYDLMAKKPTVHKVLVGLAKNFIESKKEDKKQ